jgi:hypothetical protein
MRPGHALFLTIGLLCASVAPAAAQNASQSSSNPVPGLAGLVMVFICAKRKAEEIGGWSLYFYIQLYLGVILTVAMALAWFDNYLPGTWAANPSLYPLFLLSVVPGIFILPIELVTAERLRMTRDARFVGMLRAVLWVQLGAAVIGTAIDAANFPDSLPFDVVSLIWPTIWLPYFYISRRVKRVFVTKDWIVVEPQAA